MPAWIEHLIELIFSLGLFINAFLFIPQIIKLYQTKNSESTSLLTFGGFEIIQIFIVLHGMIKHDVLLIIGYSASLLTCGIVVLLIIHYRLKKTIQKN